MSTTELSREERLRRAQALAASLAGQAPKKEEPLTATEIPCPPPAELSAPVETPVFVEESVPAEAPASPETVLPPEKSRPQKDPEALPPAKKEETEKADARALRKQRRAEKKARRKARRGIVRAILAIVRLLLVLAIVLCGLYAVDRVANTNIFHNIGNAVLELTGGLTYTSVDFQEVILGEAREKSELIVYEKDVVVESTLSQSLLNLEIFTKTQLVRAYGTGSYAVDLSALSAEDLAVDNESKTLIIRVPAAHLYGVDFDVTRTEFEQIEYGFFAFGDIDLSTEEMNEFEKSIDTAMNAELSKPEHFAEANAAAEKVLTDLFTPLVRSVDEDFSVTVRIVQ